MNEISEISQRVGTVIDRRYRVLRVLGTGGMGAVFVAEHAFTGQHVALKLLLSAVPDATTAARLMREAQLAARIKHPSVVRILDGGQCEDGTLYVVQELLEGETLRQKLEREKKLHWPDVSDIAFHVLSALNAAHDAGVIHRDIKPENIFLARDSAGATIPKLLDFGIAKDLRPVPTPALTRAGAILGTPAYMAPEQISAAREAGPQVDLWALGVVMFECLAGRTPWGDGTFAAVVSAVLLDEIPNLRSFAPAPPEWMTEIVHTALQRDPSLRFASAREMRSALARQSATRKS